MKCTFKVTNARSNVGAFGKTSTFIVSPEDVPLVRQYCWYRTNRGYIRGYKRGQAQEYVLLSRLLLGLKKGDPRKADHINLDRLDNRRSNLRVTDVPGNVHNQKVRSNTGYKGVHREARGYFKVQAGGRTRDGKVETKYLGNFNDPIVGALAYDDWVRARYVLPRLNFPREGELPAR